MYKLKYSNALYININYYEYFVKPDIIMHLCTYSNLYTVVSGVY